MDGIYIYIYIYIYVCILNVCFMSAHCRLSLHNSTVPVQSWSASAMFFQVSRCLKKQNRFFWGGDAQLCPKLLQMPRLRCQPSSFTFKDTRCEKNCLESKGDDDVERRHALEATGGPHFLVTRSLRYLALACFDMQELMVAGRIFNFSQRVPFWEKIGPSWQAFRY